MDGLDCASASRSINPARRGPLLAELGPFFDDPALMRMARPLLSSHWLHTRAIGPLLCV